MMLENIVETTIFVNSRFKLLSLKLLLFQMDPMLSSQCRSNVEGTNDLIKRRTIFFTPFQHQKQKNRNSKKIYISTSKQVHSSRACSNIDSKSMKNTY